MLWPKIAFALICSATLLPAQTLPAGTALPVELNSTLSAKDEKPGRKIEGKLMQEVQLPSGAVIKRGSRVAGHIVSAQPTRLTLQFDQIQDEHKNIPLTVSVRAIAASENVFQAGTPIDAASTDESSDEWATKQVGGDVVLRGRGLVTSNEGRVGRWSGTGVWGKLTAAGDCSDSSTGEQALWVFSTTACGVYGIEGLTMVNATSASAGQVTLQSEKDILVRGGSGWLLVTASAAAAH
jgi:hypothetical protein